MSTISRREARRAAVFMLFQWDVTGRPLGSLYEGDVDDYTRRLAGAVTEHASELDARITSASDDWTADRLGAVERNVLRVALELTVAFGKVLPDVARDVQERVASALGTMCGVIVTAVDISVEELD